MEGYKVALLWLPFLVLRLLGAFWQALTDPREMVQFTYYQMANGGIPPYTPAWKVTLLWLPMLVPMLFGVLGRSVVRPREMVEYIMGEIVKDEEDLYGNGGDSIDPDNPGRPG